MTSFRFRHLLSALALGWAALSAQTQITAIKPNLPATYTGFASIAYGNGTFVAVADNTNSLASITGGVRIATSTDGTTWTARTVTTDQANPLSKITFFKGRFILPTPRPAGNGSGVWSSPDGINWSFTANAAVGRAVSWATDGTTLVGCGDNGLLVSSTDGLTFTARTAASSAVSYISVAYGQGKWFLTANGGGSVFGSSDGITWTTSTTVAATLGGSRICFNPGNNSWLAFNQSNYFTSPDGTTFTNRGGIKYGTSPVAFVPVGTADAFVANGNFLMSVRNSAFGNGSGLYASEMGTTWSRVAAPASDLLATGIFAGWFSPDVTDLVFVNGKYYLVGSIGTPAVLFLGSVDAVAAPPEPTPPVIVTQPASIGAVAGRSATFSVTATGSGNTYQWRKDNVALAGATSATYTIASVTTTSAGSYAVVVTNAAGSVTSANATLTLVSAANAGRLVNMSIRSQSGTDADLLIVGFGLGGAGTSGAKPLLVRGIGPALGAFGLQGVLADPVMTVFQGSTPVGQNDNWDATSSAVFGAVGAFPFSPGSGDSALYNAAFAPNSYSAQIAGKNGGTGIAMAEIYDATPTAAFTATTPRLTNVSARTQVGTGADLLIAGFVVSGQTPVRVLIRAAGPALSAFGLTGVLNDPKLEVFNGATKVAENDNWDATAGSTFAGVGAFPFATGSRDAAVVVSLPPGNYSAQVSGVGNTTGIGLVEVYELP